MLLTFDIFMRLHDTRRQDITDLFLGCFTSTFLTLARQAPSPIYGDYTPLCIALGRIALGYHLPRDDWDISAARGNSQRQTHSPIKSTRSIGMYTSNRFTHRTRS